jgi:Virulence-associated protein E
MVAITPPPSLPTPNLKDTVAFLKALPQTLDGRETLVIIPEPDTKPPQTVTVPHDKVTEFLTQKQGTHNCYFQVNLGPPNKKAKKEEITHARMLHVDLDDPTPAALQSLQSFNPPPTAIIFSGGGHQAFWFFRTTIPTQTPAARDMIEDLNNRIRHALNADHCYNIDRIMRLPGTLNMPDDGKRKKGRTTALASVIELTPTYLYTLADFQHLQKAATANPSLPPPTQLGLDDIDPQELARIPEETRELIIRGDTQAQFPSRSEAVYRVACSLARANLPIARIAAILVHPAHAISASIRERPDPMMEALRQAQRGRDATSTGWPKATKSGPTEHHYPNCRVALARLEIEGCTNKFTESLYVWNPRQPRIQLTDSVVESIRDHIIDVYGFDPGNENTFYGLRGICRATQEHPLLDYFNQVAPVWDGVSRLPYLFQNYFGAEDTPFNRDIGVITMVAGIRLIKHPGTKFDTIPVLEGPQGSGKTQALIILAGGDEFFNSQDILASGAREQAEAMVGIWIYEISELQGMSKADTEKVKAFASRNVDKVRPAYGRVRVDRPRQTIFFGTTNAEDYLRDPTGNRRFWPVKTTVINLAALRRDRDQLWAEAIALEAQGRSIILNENLWDAAANLQKSRLSVDSWVEELRNVHCYLSNGTLRVSTQDVLAHLGRTADRQTPGDFKRVADAMRMLGWAGSKLLVINGKAAVRGYEAPNDDTVPHVLIPDDPAPGEPKRPGHQGHLRVVDENFTVHGKPVVEPRADPKPLD